MSQAGSPGAGNQTPEDLRGMIAKQAYDLAELQKELKQAFPTVQSQIAALEVSSQSTVGIVATLANHVSTISGALANIQETLDTLSTRTSVSGVAASVADTSPSSPSAASGSMVSPAPLHSQSEPNIVSPRPYDGDFNRCRGFLAQCELLFTHQPSRYSSDGSKIALVMSLLVDEALSWAIAAVEGNPALINDFSLFKREFQAVFNHPVDGKDAASRLLVIRQGSRTVAQYTLEFRILAAESRWDANALLCVYRKGLSDAIKDLIVRDSPEALNDLISLALQMDARLQERRADRAYRNSPRQPPSRPAMETPTMFSASRAQPPPTPVHSLFPPTPGTGEPMEIGRSRLTPGERELRMNNQLCLYCGDSGHFIRACPTRPKDPARR